MRRSVEDRKLLKQPFHLKTLYESTCFKREKKEGKSKVNYVMVLKPAVFR
jgi:hypothetical protein